jgi:hypothetical protein
VRWKLPIGLAGAAAMVAGFVIANMPVDTRILKDGHRLHLNCLLFDKGGTVEIRDPSVTFATQLKAFLQRKRVPGRTNIVTSHPVGLVYPEVWIEVERPKGEAFRNRHMRAEIHLPGGQVLGERFSGAAFHECGFDFCNARLPSLPTTVKRLDLRIVVDEESFRFDVRNPAYRKASALPPIQTLPLNESRGDLVAVLEGFDVHALDEQARKERGYNVWVRPKLRLWWNGSPADEWFDKKVSFGNASGYWNSEGWVFKEPYWKVRITVSKNSKFPTSMDELVQFDPANIRLAPGEIREIPLPQKALSRWSRALLLGHGSYAMTAEGPINAEIDPVSHSPLGPSPDVLTREVAVLLIGDEAGGKPRASWSSREAEWFARDDQGQPVNIGNRRSLNKAGRIFEHTELSRGPNSKTVQLTFFPRHSEIFEYTVTPPSFQSAP